MRILCISDIHGNFPALNAVHERESGNWDLVLNAGDSLVYAPFANQTLNWLKQSQAISIRGNTDRKVIRLLKDKPFNKPSHPEKRIMYTHTAANLTPENQQYLLGLKKCRQLKLLGWKIGLYHGSPADPEEFLFADTPDSRLAELAASSKEHIILCGHSHTPFHRLVGGVHFINPGSVGRMFDGSPKASYAMVHLQPDQINIYFHRIPYPVEEVTQAILDAKLPKIYTQMYSVGRKLN
ncbi:MAG: YfcE family phosphodiesterase [Deltaproteobacteria bacterium]|nr:MAG: YfcE family phosphodiesterase [Deltaproteobacteria bacterium]